MATKEIPAGDLSPESYRKMIEFLEYCGLVPSIKPEYNVHDAFSKVIGGVIKVNSTDKGKISCIVNAKPPILNGTGRMHGLSVASVAERVAIACAKTVVGDNDLFLGELSISYLSSAPRRAEVVVDGSVVRTGKTLTIVEVSFRAQDSGRLLYLSRATLYNKPLSSL